MRESEDSEQGADSEYRSVERVQSARDAHSE